MHTLNILSIWISSYFGLKEDKSNDFKEVQPSNILSIGTILFFLKEDKSGNSKDSQFSNNDRVDLTFIILKEDKSIDFLLYKN